MRNKKDEDKASAFEIISTIVKIICVIFLLLFVAVVALQRFSDNEIAIGGIRVFNVVTGSMVPTYEVGDVILVKETDANELKENDVVTYKGKESGFAGRVITHRLIRIDDSGSEKIFYTKGDANSVEDPAIKGDQIYGKVIYKCVVISALAKLANNLTAFYILVFIPVGLIVFFEIKDRILSKGNDSDDEEDDDEDESDD